MEPTITQNGALFRAQRARAATPRGWFGNWRRAERGQHREAAVAEEHLHVNATLEGSVFGFR